MASDKEMLKTHYCIEYLTSKGWEIYSFHEGLTTAINEFRNIVANDTDYKWRLTTPMGA